MVLMLFAQKFLKCGGEEEVEDFLKSDDKELKCHSASAITLSADQYSTVGGP